MSDLIRLSDGFNYQLAPLSLGFSLMPSQEKRPSWKGFYHESYGRRLQEILSDVLGDIDMGIPDLVPAQLTLHPRFWCGRSLLPFHQLSGSIKALLRLKLTDDDILRTGEGYAPRLTNEIERQLKYFRYRAEKGDINPSTMRRIFSNCQHLLQHYLKAIAHINLARMKIRVMVMSEKMEDVVRDWKSIESSVSRGDYYGNAPSAQQYWFENRKHLKPALMIQRELSARGQFLSPAKRAMFQSYFESPSIPEQYDLYDLGHSGMALIDYDA